MTKEPNKHHQNKVKLWIGIAGAGLMGKWHGWAAKKAGGRISAIMDTDHPKADYLAKKFPGSKTYNNFEEMIKKAEMDVLHVCTPLNTHFEIADAALDNGINLLIDKLLGVDLEQCESLLKKAKANSLLICPVHQFIFQDGVLKAKELIRNIGTLIRLEATFCSAGGEGLSSNLLDEVVSDILPHPISLIHYFLPITRSKINWITVHPDNGELIATGSMSGVSLSIFISMSARPTECSFRIYGTEGTIHLDLFHGYTFLERGKVSRLNKATRPFEIAFKRLAASSLNLVNRTFNWEPAFPGLYRLVSLFYKAVYTKSESPITQEDVRINASAREQIINKSRLGSKNRKTNQ